MEDRERALGAETALTRSPFRAVAFALIATSALAATGLQAQTAESVDLTGLWKAKKSFGPDARGPLLITRTTSGYSADMMGVTVPVRVENGELWFGLPNGRGGFRGKQTANGTIRGIWFVAPVGGLGPGTPVTLSPNGQNRSCRPF